ncbi:MAG: polysaccharide deacetylase family protein [Firmicutes bacterium]|nr:polysaccharide deacetylase family protein [Bacillota bacterium]
MRTFLFVVIILLPIVLFSFVTPNHGYETKASTDEEITLPIIMYHRVLNSQKGKYTVSEKQLESDFIALKNAGYETVLMREVIDWIDGKGTLPSKPIVLTFDDGHYNNMHYALPLAKKHNAKFMVNPVTSFSKFSETSNDHSNPNYSHLTFSQMKEMQDTGLVEIGNHTHALHKFKPRYGIAQVNGENLDTYIKTIKKDIDTAQDLIESSGVPRPTTFAYPFGKSTQAGKELLIEMGFRAILTCNEGVNTIKQGEVESLHRLRRYNRDGWWTSDKLIKTIEQN